MTLPSWVVSLAMGSPLQNGLIADHRDVGGDPLPADVGKAHPGLALPSGHVATAHLVDQVHGGDVAAQRQDIEAVTLFLGAGTGRPRQAMGMDAVEAVAVLVVGEPDGMRAVPERAVEHRDVL